MTEMADFKLVRNSAIGPELTEEKAKILAEKLGVHHFKNDELIVSEGATDQNLYILVAGKIAVTSKGPGGKEKLVYTMNEGECAGTRAFVERTPRKATLRAVGDATVYSLTPKDFEEILDANPRLAFKVMRALFRITHSNLSRLNQEAQQLSNYINKTGGRY